jgi:D-hydroxyproline dehydrogenase subunit alpha
MTDTVHFDVVIVGGGPAGLTAAMDAARETSSVAIVDMNAGLGGQIWRRDGSAPLHPYAQRVSERVTFIGGATVVDAVSSDGRHRLEVLQADRSFAIETATLILATGARELFLPFPGWTLPGVVGVGGFQAMMKSGLDVRGRRVVVAGTGPLLVAVAATAVKKGAEVVAVVEQASWASMARFGLGVATRPRIAVEGLRYMQQLGGGTMRLDSWVSAARGDGWVSEVTIDTPGNADRVDCDYLCTGYGLVPNTEIARRLGCAVRGGGIAVDGKQATSVPGVYAAGECTGVAGVYKALHEGRIAGAAAVGASPAGVVFMRDRAARWGAVLDRVFALRPEVLSLAEPNTIVCRCEDVRLRAIDPTWSPRQAKLYARAGMGACQGRVCGAALQRMFGWPDDTVRPPLQPTTVSSLLGAG